MSNILVCGGAGYIGSHMVQWLASAGHSVTVLDNLSTGHREAVKWGRFIQVDLLDKFSLRNVFRENKFESVMHFCAKSIVGDSVKNPYDYYINNVVGTLNLLEEMRNSGVNKLVFSSTAAVFGNPLEDFIDEDHPTNPINPYGSSKLMVEKILKDASASYGLRSVSLRYFNAAGALAEHGIGEAHDCETHLIPNAIFTALGLANPIKLFGDDYPTYDGTCVRDYVHVQDLAQAHALSLDFMEFEDGAHVFNLGNGQGFSVREVISEVSRVANRDVPYEVASRRPGDPARLVASSKRAKSVLGWDPKWTELHDIIRSAWEWHNGNNKYKLKK